MFNLFISLTQAWNQVGMFAAALVCLGIGGLLLANSLYCRVHAVRASGKIVGVLPEGSVYFPVFSYTGPDNQLHYAKSDTGSGAVNGMQTGRIVPLLISAHDPAEARQANDHLLEIIGLAIFAPGIWLAYTAMTAYPITWMTFLMAGALVLYSGERLHKIVKPKAVRLSIAEWKEHRNRTTVDISQVRPIEAITDSSNAQQTTQWRQGNPKLAIPLLAFFTIILVAAALYETADVDRLEQSGLRAQGEVVRIVEKSDSHGEPSFYPVVRFNAANNATVEFEDGIGSNPPLRHSGDRVAVLYLADNPSHAIIDRGKFGNWVLPAILLLAAGLVGWIFWKVLQASLRSQPRTRTQPSQPIAIEPIPLTVREQ